MKRSAVLLLLAAAILVLVPVLAAQDANVDVYGRPLPEDAAPYEMQVWQDICDATATKITFSAVESVYQRLCGAAMFGDPLVNLDENLNIIPGAAESWDVSEDGLTWSFHLRPGQDFVRPGLGNGLHAAHREMSPLTGKRPQRLWSPAANLPLRETLYGN